MQTHSTTSGALASGRHPVHVGHLVMGLAFVGLVGVWALVQGNLVGGDDVRWLLPVPWVLAGAAGLLAATLSGRSRRPALDRATRPPDPGYDDPGPFPDPPTTDSLATDQGRPDTVAGRPTEETR